MQHGTVLLDDESDERLTAHAEGDYADFHAKHRAPTKTELVKAFDGDDCSDDVLGLIPTGALEAEFTAALVSAFSELLADVDSLKRADAARIRLARAGDPLGLMDGDGNANEAPETNAPTPERVANRGMFETLTITNVTGRERNSEVWRKVPTVEAMIRRGQIDRDDAQNYLEAAQTFYRDFILGHRQGGLTAKYGEQCGKGGTPISQQRVSYYTDKHGVQHEVMGPDERRTHHHTAWISACQAIGVYQDPVTGAPRPGRAVQWMQKLVCEDFFLAEEAAPTLADAGRAYLGCKCPKQAAAAGATMLKMSLERLVNHYGLR